MFDPHVILIYFYSHHYTNVSLFLLKLTKKYDKKEFKIEKREYTTNSGCLKLYFTPGVKILQRQCPCVRVKFNVCMSHVTDITTYRLNRPRGQFRETYIVSFRLYPEK